MNRKIRFGGTAVALLAVAGIASVIAAAPAFAATAPFATATSQMDNINVPNVDTQASTPTTVTNDGTGSTAPTVVSTSNGNGAIMQSASAPNYQLAQAGTGGTSLACTGLDVNTNTLVVNADGKSCSGTGSLFSPAFNLAVDPVLANALESAGCSGMFLNFQAMVSYAYSDGTAAPSGGTSMSSVGISPCGRFGSTFCAKQTMTFDPSANHDFLAQIIGALNAAGTANCSQLATALQGVASQVTLLSNYQTTKPDGSFQVSAIHFANADASSTYDFAISSVGPNLVPTVDTPMLSAATPWLVGGAVLLALLVAVRVRTRSVLKQ